jgi:hypothetical protein
MATIAEQVQGMNEEQVYHKFSKSAAKVTVRRVQRAMRVLLAQE